MSQQQVLELLESEDKWMTTKEIAKELNQETGSISSNLKRLFTYKEVHRKSVRINNNYEFVWRRI